MRKKIGMYTSGTKAAYIASRVSSTPYEFGLKLIDVVQVEMLGRKDAEKKAKLYNGIRDLELSLRGARTKEQIRKGELEEAYRFVVPIDTSNLFKERIREGEKALDTLKKLQKQHSGIKGKKGFAVLCYDQVARRIEHSRDYVTRTYIHYVTGPDARPLGPIDINSLTYGRKYEDHHLEPGEALVESKVGEHTHVCFVGSLTDVAETCKNLLHRLSNDENAIKGLNTFLASFVPEKELSASNMI